MTETRSKQTNVPIMTGRGYYIWETEDFDATEEDAQEIAAFVLTQAVHTLAYPIYGVKRTEHELQDHIKQGGGSVLLVDEFRDAVEESTSRVAMEVAPLLASRQEAILDCLRAGDRWGITTIYGEVLALALAGVDRWYPQPRPWRPPSIAPTPPAA